jgi:hypothetical protein
MGGLASDVATGLSDLLAQHVDEKLARLDQHLYLGVVERE